MSQVISVLTLLASLIADLSGSSSTIAKVISWLREFVSLGIKEAKDVVPLIKNIIEALRSKEGVTAEQLADLEDIEKLADAEFEAAAARAGFPAAEQGSSGGG